MPGRRGSHVISSSLQVVRQVIRCEPPSSKGPKSEVQKGPKNESRVEYGERCKLPSGVRDTVPANKRFCDRRYFSAHRNEKAIRVLE